MRDFMVGVVLVPLNPSLSVGVKKHKRAGYNSFDRRLVALWERFDTLLLSEDILGNAGGRLLVELVRCACTGGRFVVGCDD